MMLEFLELALKPLPPFVSDQQILEIARYLRYHKLTVITVVTENNVCWIFTKNHKIAVTFKVSPERWKVSNISLLS